MEFTVQDIREAAVEIADEADKEATRIGLSSGMGDKMRSMAIYESAAIMLKFATRLETNMLRKSS